MMSFPSPTWRTTNSSPIFSAPRLAWNSAVDFMDIRSIIPFSLCIASTGNRSSAIRRNEGVPIQSTYGKSSRQRFTSCRVGLCKSRID